MKRFRLLLAAVVFGLGTTACSADIVGPTPTDASATEMTAPSFGQGTFGSGG